MDSLKYVPRSVLEILFWNLIFCSLIFGGEVSRNYVVDLNGNQPKPTVALDNVCAWPNLTLLGDGTIIASIHNQPSHLKRPADVDCWASVDGGKSWVKRGTPAPRENERVARGNVAAGVANNGDLVVITSGWSDPPADNRGSILPPIISRSTDGGCTWTIGDKIFPGTAPEATDTITAHHGPFVPFGDILQGDDGGLYVGLYNAAGLALVYCSRDDGITWGEPAVLNKEVVIHEPALLHLGKGKWLAAARLDGLELYTSDDDAKTWTHRKKLTGNAQHPGHFTKLKDGRVLLSYGNRQKPKGVDVRFSDDEGQSWSDPFRVVDFQGDGGYPSSVHLPDGQVLTAYYAAGIDGHDRYHMGVVIWDPNATQSH